MADRLQQRFTEHLRLNNRYRCVICSRSQFDRRGLGRHLETEHDKQTTTQEGAAELQRLIEAGRPRDKPPDPALPAVRTHAPSSSKRPSPEPDIQPGDQSEGAGGTGVRDRGPDWSPSQDKDDDEGSDRRKRIKSPTSSVQVQHTQGSPTTTSRSRARPQLSARAPGDTLADPRNPKGRRIWEGGSLRPSGYVPGQRGSSRYQEADEEEDRNTVERCIKQPQTRPISHEQLVAEVKGIYAGLVMVESKCIEVDNGQNAQSASDAKLSDEQWQALIALHRTLLHEHHDFFLASQHPSASAALRRLALKYAMPARMWRHGIHSFLELLRARLPESREHMLSFIYLAYSIMALLFETVPAFEDVWIECLGDLGRYRMAIEDDDLRDREVWTTVSRRWYSRASDKTPSTGRLYHHLAILARPHAVQQLFFYTKSLTVAVPFPAARESILTLLDPVLSDPTKVQTFDLAFVEVHALMFTKRHLEKLPYSMTKYHKVLDEQIARNPRAYIEMGYLTAIVNCSAELEYGSESNCLIQTISQAKKEVDAENAMVGIECFEPDVTPSEIYIKARSFSVITDEIILRRFGDTSCFGYIHARLVWLLHLAETPQAMAYMEDFFPWKLLVLSLNFLLADQKDLSSIEAEAFPRPEKGEQRPLREDWALRGYPGTDNYFPSDWFRPDLDEEDKAFETASMTQDRKERILWLAVRLARYRKWITYDGDIQHRFNAVAKYDMDVSLVLKKEPGLEDGSGTEDSVTDRDTTMSSPPTIIE
ncbi:uncharacterized protein E0L32_010536 [Thyridium curvatum]|uniref:DNA/RNA-binding domain-containing protein n=1 Tax=Thyridium curvatum TaxID=1093900 RepID=A0A507AN83_9PEZI|nr:uncharacterized protein E0L32_010536 [Thyridium curvatum]TPX07744.1 hypothetical protein E0L32_010536 [Thyridium curvatum]